MNNLNLDKRTIAGISAVLMITSAIALIFAGGAAADFPGTLTDEEIDPEESYVGIMESYTFWFTTEQRIDLGTGENGDNIVLRQEDFNFDEVENENVRVSFWSDDKERYVALHKDDVDGTGENLVISGLGDEDDEDDNISPPVQMKVEIQEEEVRNPLNAGTYTIAIETYAYDPDWDTEHLDEGSVDVDIIYPDEVTENTVYLESSEESGWYGTIQEAVNDAVADDNVKVTDEYTGEPLEGALAWPIEVDIEGLTIKAYDDHSPVVDAENAENAAFGIKASDVTIEDLKIIGADSNNLLPVIMSEGENLTVSGVEIEIGHENNIGIWTDDKLNVEDTTIKDGNYGILQVDNTSDVTITGSTFESLDNFGFAVVDNEEDFGAFADNIEGDYTVEESSFTDIGAGIVFAADENITGDISVTYTNFVNADMLDNLEVIDKDDDGVGAITVVGETDEADFVASHNWWNDPAGPLAHTEGDRGENINICVEGAITPWLDAPYPYGELVESIEFDRDAYSGVGAVTVTARAGYLLGEEELSLEVESNEDSLTLELEEEFETGVFENSFWITDNDELAYEKDDHLLVDNVEDELVIEESLDHEWKTTATALVDMVPPVVDNILFSEVNDDSWVIEGEEGTWAENKIWVRGDIEVTVNFTEENPEELEFVFADRVRTRTEGLEDGTVTFEEYVNRLDDGVVSATATVTDKGGLYDTLTENAIVDLTGPDVEIVSPEKVGFGPLVDETTIPIQVDANDNVVEDVPGSGVKAVVADIPALENDIPLEYNPETGYWENSITADIENMDNFEVTATATDRVDLEGTATETATVEWDNVPPTIEDIEVIYPEGFTEAKIGDNVTVKATVTDDVAVRDVYINAENLGLDNWIEMTHIGDNVYSYESDAIDLPEDEIGDKQLTITATDTANNEATAPVDVIVSDTYTTYQIGLEGGWNLISLPLIPDDPDIEVILDDVMDNVVSVWGYDAAEKEWMFFDPDDPDAGDLEYMEDGWGYWIEMDEGIDTTLTIDGTETLPGEPEVPPAYDLYEGWNLIGFTNLTSMPAEEYMGEYVVDRTRSMFWYDQATDRLRRVGVRYLVMEPGKGYWIYVNEDVDLVPLT